MSGKSRKGLVVHSINYQTGEVLLVAEDPEDLFAEDDEFPLFWLGTVEVGQAFFQHELNKWYACMISEEVEMLNQDPHDLDSVWRPVGAVDSETNDPTESGPLVSPESSKD